MCKTTLLDFVHHLNYQIKHFRSWILLSSSGKQGRRGQKTYMLSPPVELASGPGLKQDSNSYVACSTQCGSGPYRLGISLNNTDTFFVSVCFAAYLTHWHPFMACRQLPTWVILPNLAGVKLQQTKVKIAILLHKRSGQCHVSFVIILIQLL